MSVNTLLVLGSKPDPMLPNRSDFTAIACANGSGYSATRNNLPSPDYTVMSAVLPALASGRQSLEHIKNLQTDRVYYYPRPPVRRSVLKQILQFRTLLLTRPQALQKKLNSLGYHYAEFIAPGHDFYATIIRSLCDNDPVTMRAVNNKQPSTGIMTLLLGLHESRCQRFILAGFSFELTHAYGHNPEIDQRQTQSSRHGDTDIAVLTYVSRKFGNIFTTEPVVAERTAIPLLASATSSN